VKTEALRTALAHIRIVTAEHSVSESTSCVKITGDTLIASRGRCGISVTTEDSGVEVTVDAKRLAVTVGKLTSDDVDLSVSGNQLVIKGGPQVGRIRTSDAEIELLDVSTEKTATILSDELTRILDVAAIASSKNTGPQSLQGRVLLSSGENVSAVGCNASDLCQAWADGGGDEFSAILDTEAAKDLARICSLHKSQQVELSASENMLAISIDGVMYYTGLCEGQYSPSWKRVLKTRTEEAVSSIEVGPDSFARAIEFAMTSQDPETVALWFENSTGQLDVSSKKQSFGESVATVDGTCAGDEFCWAYNPTTVLAFLKKSVGMLDVKFSENAVVVSSGNSVCLVSGMER